MINRDSDGLSELLSETGFLDFLECESSAISELGVVFLSAAVNHWSQSLHWSWEDSGCLVLSGDGSSVLACGLIEPSLEEPLSVLPQMDIRENVVVFDHLCLIY